MRLVRQNFAKGGRFAGWLTFALAFNRIIGYWHAQGPLSLDGTLAMGKNSYAMLDKFENQEIKMGSERGFGLVFFCVFLIIAAWPMVSGDSPRLWALAVSLIFLALALVRPAVLAPLNKLWFQFGLLLGKIVTPIVMLLVFFLTVFPTGLIMRLLGKDLLNIKIDRSAPSYWIKRDGPAGSMRDQF